MEEVHQFDLHTQPAPSSTPVFPKKKGKFRRKLKKALLGLGIASVPGSLAVHESLKYHDVRAAISGTVGEVRHAYEDLFNGEIESEILNAKNREGLSPEEYHRRILFTAPVDGHTGAEIPGQHRMRVHLVPGSEPRPLVFAFGGNQERLYDPSPTDDPNLVYGSRFVFENLAKNNDCHVIQMRLGEEISRGGKLNHAVVFEHVKNIVSDATKGVGMFKNCKPSEIRFFGYSYGAGVVQELTDPKQGLLPTNLPIGPTAYVDGITFRTVPPVALTAPPTGSPKHFQAWQTNSHRRAGFACGTSLTNPREQDCQVNLTDTLPDIGHVEISFSQKEELRNAIYGPVTDFLGKKSAVK